MKRTTLGLMAAITLAGCAGRDARPVAVVQPADSVAECDAVMAEIASNTLKIADLLKEENEKRAQNIVAGTVGAVLFFPVLFAMDFKDAAGEEREALEARNSYLSGITSSRCQGVSETPVG